MKRCAFAIDNQRLYDEAQHAVRLREEVLEVISHDLRNPLQLVRFSAGLLTRSGGSEGEVHQRAELILTATTRMERLITDLVDVAAIRSGQLSIERKPTNATKIVLEVCEGLEDQAGRTGVTEPVNENETAVVRI